ncbi:flagellar operon protein [Clostridium putrefaciens]|uniref:Flagellar operon protein n=1 Tax=Clostridium putrefaciens TaxID=99675 RepID=A0A381J902_9CLOT|nr:TIGR02530 family flagellar biosynthesis protein [Clostridium putrefaciens]SUY47479.1 flagellar operon protein [Clostridium putrefaciens]
MSYRIINGRPYVVDNLHIPSCKETYTKDNSKEVTKGKSFNEVLKSKLEKDIKVSNHASERIKDLNIDYIDMEAIKEGMNKAEKKGSKNSLIFYKDVAFIASIQNRTIITVIDKDRAKENVFTNIDSVVIL